MPGTHGGGMNTPPRTLAEKLTWLRESSTPEGERPASWNTVARQITDVTGVKISGPYLWELASNKPGTNPKLSHLEALGEYYNRRVSYFVDGEAAFEDDVDAQLELLNVLKRLGVRDIRLQNVDGASAGLETVQGLLARLQTLDLLGDDRVREIALRISKLTAEQRDALGGIADQPKLLEARPRVGHLTLAASGLSEDQLIAAAVVVGQPDLLEALGDEGVREIARRCSTLLGSSREALLAMVAQLERLESGRA